MTTEGVRLSKFPVEIVDHIFSFLPLPDRKSASLVCRLWNELAFDDRYMRHVVINFSGWESSNKISYLRKSSRRYRNILAYLGRELHREIFFDIIIEVLDHIGSELRSFHCMALMSEKQLWSVISRVPKLEQLIVGFYTSSSRQQECFFPELKNLKDLRLLENVHQIQSLNIPALTQFSGNFSDSWDAKESLAALRRMAPQLKRLELQSSENFIPIDELQFPNVEKLELSGQIYQDASNSALRALFSGFKCLKEVDLIFNTEQLVLDIITKECPGIEKLHFENHPLNPNSFSLLERLKRLETLSLVVSIDTPIILESKPLVSVKRLCLQIYNMDADASVIKGLRKLLPNVNDVSVILATYFKPENVLDHICRSFSHIKRIYISHAWNPQLDGNLLGTLQHLDHLEELLLNGIHTPVELMVPNRHMKRLTLEHCRWLTDGNLLNLAQLYPNLKYLELVWCTKVTPRGLEKFRSVLADCVVYRVRSNPLRYTDSKHQQLKFFLSWIL
ncbi:uncharacterized protein LOC134219555 [Armigeres subalbatus]|uniref:uncharacterized protein LOC134219555 n=1 Tax=Armigeres subalbatus TaxID=124917 RepID=UPI002ECFF9D3